MQQPVDPANEQEEDRGRTMMRRVRKTMRRRKQKMKKERRERKERHRMVIQHQALTRNNERKTRETIESTKTISFHLPSVVQLMQTSFERMDNGFNGNRLKFLWAITGVCIIPLAMDLSALQLLPSLPLLSTVISLLRDYVQRLQYCSQISLLSNLFQCQVIF